MRIVQHEFDRCCAVCEICIAAHSSSIRLQTVHSKLEQLINRIEAMLQMLLLSFIFVIADCTSINKN